MFRVIGPRAHRQNRDRLARLFDLRETVVRAAGPGVYACPVPEPGRDRFDTAESVYVLAGDGGVLQGCIRLNPTTSPHMLGDFLAPHCDVPAGPGIWEGSRLVVDTGSVPDPLDQFELRCRLALGMTAWCLDEGIGQIVWLVRHAHFSKVAETFRTQALGEPIHLAEGGGWIPAMSAIDLEALDHLIERLRIAPEIVADLIAAGLDQTGACIA